MSQAYKKGKYYKTGTKAISKPYQRPGMIMVPRPVMGGNYLSNKPADFYSSSAEIKCVDLVSSSQLFLDTGIITPLNFVAPGSAFYQRIGRRIEMKSIRIAGNCNIKPILSAQTVYYGFYGRVLIVYDRQTNGALPALSDILQTVPQTGVPSTNNYSDINLNNRDRFTIIRDQRLTFQNVFSNNAPTPFVEGVSAPDPLNPIYNLDFYCKLKGLVTQFKADSAAATIADIATGALYLVVVGAFPTPAWQFNFAGRLRYYDRSG